MPEEDVEESVEEGEEEEVIELPFTETDMTYLDDEMTSLIELEINRRKISQRVLSAIADYIEISKMINAMGVTYRALVVDTGLLDYLASLYYDGRLEGEEEKLVGKMLRQDKLLRIWFADIIRLRNSFIISVKERKLRRLKTIIRRMDSSLIIGKKLFNDFNRLFREYRKMVLEEYTKPKDVEKMITYIG